jgi:hypothetical protein
MRIFFFIEIILNFVTEITDGRGRPVSTFRGIAAAYLKGWFVPDLIASIPSGAITGNYDIEYFLTMIRLSKLPNALNMVDGRGISLLITLLRGTGSRDENVSANFIMRYIGSLTQMMLNMVLLCYCSTCIFFWHVK